MDTRNSQKPLLFVDVDGVISLFGFREGYGLATGNAPFSDCPPGRLHSINGVMHYISGACGAHLRQLAAHYELVWATGWEDRANEHLPFLLKLPFESLPVLRFDGRAVFGSAHWKVDAINEYAADRPAAWIDDNMSEECHAWANRRSAPTLLVETSPSEGLTDEHVQQLLDWAASLGAPVA